MFRLLLSTTSQSVLMTLGAACLVLEMAPLAHAQDSGSERFREPSTRIVFADQTALRMTSEEELQLRSIDTQSSWATGLYIGSVVAVVIGAPGALLFGFVCALGASSDTCAIATTTAVLGGVGLVGLGLAIGLDVDSGFRRRALLESVRMRLTLSLEGLRLTGSF